ncbi:MAG: transposase family protein [Pseudomonadota bacterium]
MSKANAQLTSFFKIFEALEDHRKLHPLPEISLVILAGIAANSEGWSDIELFTKQRLELLREYLDFVNGVPSDDTLRRFFRAVDPEQFQRLFTTWATRW